MFPSAFVPSRSPTLSNRILWWNEFKMKYNTISSSSIGSELKKSTLTIYTDPDFVDKTAEMSSIRGELEIVQRALNQQTKRCRQLVAEYTRRLQEKEQQYQSEKLLRDNQLAKVLRALLIFEARLKQEQKYISHQLKEKDYIINKQRDHIHKLSMNQHCKHCNQYFNNIPVGLESIDSSSEYVTTDIHDYQSSNFESLGSSNETYATISEKEFESGKAGNSEESVSGDDVAKIIEAPKFQKNKQNNSLTRRNKKYVHKKSVGTYFEVLKLRNENTSPSSNDDNTSNDLESLPTECMTAEKIEAISERIENIFSKCTSVDLTESNLDKHDKDCNTLTTKLDKAEMNVSQSSISIASSSRSEEHTIRDIEEIKGETKISDAIPVFDAEGESNDNWYASASDQEDDAHCDIYRNNPVLECMNQILLQNINDPIQSPPKSPTVERKTLKNNKKVKFSDEEVPILQAAKNNAKEMESETQSNYYETPVQKHPNFYETPQSIYSNDYEQILSKTGDNIYKDTQVRFDVNEVKHAPLKKLVLTRNIELKSPTEENHYYIDMETKSIKGPETNVVRKSKILRTPPALPPKPANLVSKYKIAVSPTKLVKPNLETASLDSEPDYCSISELNLPPNKTNTKKLNVVAEINTKLSNEDCNASEKHIILHSPKQKEMSTKVDPLSTKENINLLVSQNIEIMNAQLVKQSNIKSENLCTSPTKSKLKVEPEIPKLPQVSEIIIPEDDPPKKDDCIANDNYVKNNSQILKIKPINPEIVRRSIVVGSSVSSIISGFNNQQVLSEMRQKPNDQRKKLNVAKLSSFECRQNYEKPSPKLEKQPETPDFGKFDLSQNFEEFKLDDCEIGEDFSIRNIEDNFLANAVDKEEHIIPADIIEEPIDITTSRVEVVRATNGIATVSKLNVDTVDQLRKKLEVDMNSRNVKKEHNRIEPSYEHFLECTGLSSKSILTPSRMLSNHKSMLKPKDVKLRSKVKSNNIHERQSGTIKYWSEPYI